MNFEPYSYRIPSKAVTSHRWPALFLWVISGLLFIVTPRAAAQQKKDLEHIFTPQVMVRGEYLHGYQTLPATDAKPGAFIAQRTRLTYKLAHKNFDIVVAPQDVRVWGAANHLSPDTSGSLSLAEGYGVVKFNAANRLKIGRQIIQYEEHRILGSLDWGMQSRRHDLLLFQHVSDSTLSFDIGAAWNQDKANPASTVYRLKNHYKTLQYLWLFKKWPSADLGFLLLNNGFQFSKTNGTGNVENSTVFSQTLGFNANFKPRKFKFLAWAYLQTGKDADLKDARGDPKNLRAFDAALNVNYAPPGLFTFSLGGEYLSGTSQDSTQQDRANSFNPFYGTNHRFNGYMDYFYVGNHINSVGLLDAYFKINFERKNLGLSLSLHHFLAAEDVKDVEKSSPANFVAMKTALGQEADFTLTFKVFDGVSIQAGYSQFFGTETLQALKGGDTGETSNWAYLMVFFRPGTAFPKTGLKQ